MIMFSTFNYLCNLQIIFSISQERKRILFIGGESVALFARIEAETRKGSGTVGLRETSTGF